MLGDFNEVLSGDDKYGESQINLNKALEFKECLDNCKFLDLGFVGPKFTWTNKRPITSLILERLDRYFANPSRRILYHKTVVIHLPRTFSNHCPILIELMGTRVNRSDKPFHFQTMWMLCLRFPKVVEEA